MNLVIRVILAILIAALVYFLAAWLLALLAVPHGDTIAVILAILVVIGSFWYGPKDFQLPPR